MDTDRQIREQILRAIALNRVPGYHFPGNFVDISFDEIGPETSRLSLDAAPHCAGSDGQMEIGAIALLADLALAACIRANLGRETRLATVTMSLQFTGAPRTGRIEAHSVFDGFFAQGAARLGQSRVSLQNGEGAIGYGSGSFMALPAPAEVRLHPVPHRRRGDPALPRIQENELTREEESILRRADAILAEGEAAFLPRLWDYEPRKTASGASCSMENGPHVGNRVGHVQGGVLLGLAAATASAALPHNWALTGLSGWYVRPGQGPTIRARSAFVHHGQSTAVVRTQVAGREGKRVIEVMTTHAKGGGA